MKNVLIVLGVVAILIVGAVLYFGSNLGSIVGGIIEDVGTDTLGTKVVVGGVELSLADRSGSIREVTVANPAGFSSEPALQLGELAITLGPEPHHVTRILVGAPRIRVERVGNTTNIAAIKKNLDSGGEGESSEVRTDTGEPVILTIDRIDVASAQAVLVVDTRTEPTDLSVDAVSFTNLTGTPAQITEQFTDQLLGHVQKAAVARGAAQAQKKVEERVREETGELGDKLAGKLRDRD